MMARRDIALIVAVCLGQIAPLSADTPGAPLSAIPWLSETLEVDPKADEPRAAPVRERGDITVKTLDGPSVDAAGILSPSIAGLPADLWIGSATNDLTRLIRAMPDLTSPALQQLFRTLLLVEADPPADDAEGMLLARIDALLVRGALDPAQALLEQAGPDTAPLFRRWFDISLLNGTEERGCAILRAKPDLSPNYETRIFCLARDGRWTTAALTLETATALDRITPESRERLARFLDPDLFEGEGPAPRPDPVTPLDFRLLEAVGEPVPTTGLPLAFVHTDLRHIIGWKAQLDAAERLARAGSLPANSLLGIYTARRPAASGGIWERVRLIQELDIALTAGNADDIARLLPEAGQAMHDARLDSIFAALFAARLQRLDLPDAAGRMAYETALISNDAPAFVPPNDDLELPPGLAFASAVATGRLAGAKPTSPMEEAISAALSATAPPAAYRRMLAENRTGEALLTAISRLALGGEGDIDDSADALQLLATLGHEGAARHAALQLLMLDPRG